MNFNQHRNIEFPAELRQAGFRDESWKNDACARAFLFLNGIAYTVWCDYEDEDMREVSSKRFTLIIAKAKDEQDAYESLGDPERDETVVESDDINDIMAALEKVGIR